MISTIEEKIKALADFQFSLQTQYSKAEELCINQKGIEDTIINVAMQLETLRNLLKS